MRNGTLENPLYSTRAPEGIRHPHLDGGYLRTHREDVANDTGAINIYNDMFRYKPDPTLEIDIQIWEDFPDMKAIANLHRLTSREGFEIMKADEWDLLDEVTKMAWKPDEAGRLTFGGKATHTLVLIWRTGEEAERAENARRAGLSKINKTPAELRAEMAEKYGPLGASVRVEDGPEGMSDEEMADYEERLARKSL